jgi:integrase
MRAKIGHKAIAAMQPDSILWDEEVRGFNARRQFSGVITYSVIYRTRDGIQRWHKIGRATIFTPDLARKEAIRILRDVALGNDPSGERQAIRNSMTVAQLCDLYQADMQSGKLNGKKVSTIKSDANRIKNHIMPKLGKFKVATITSEQIERFMNELSKGSAGRIIALTSTIFTFAVKRRLRTDNPVSAVEKPTDIKRTRRLSNAEYQQLWAAVNGGATISPIMADLFQLLAVTGFRSGEARLLKWAELDLERCCANLEDTKTGQSARPLSSAAIDIIQRQERRGQYVFSFQRDKPIGSVNKHWGKLGMAKDVTPHTLRHSFASLAGDMGLADSTIAGLLGHKRQSITSRYIHLDKALIVAANEVAGETLRLMRA